METINSNTTIDKEEMLNSIEEMITKHTDYIINNLYDMYYCIKNVNDIDRARMSASMVTANKAVIDVLKELAEQIKNL
jgi:23S rRNA U2552 (ribose-2'-O)-methylase RlmE/FtsJ